MTGDSESSCRLIPATDAQSWLQALHGMPHDFGHRPEYALAASDVTGFETALWVYDSRDERDGRAACVVALRDAPGGFDIVTPLGFAGFALLGDVPELAEAWTRNWTARGAIAAYVQLSPFQSPGRWQALLPGLSALLKPGQDCWCWDLRPSPDALLAGMSSKHRQLLRKWLREEARVEWDQRLLRVRFNDLYGDFLGRQEIPSVYHYHPQHIDLMASAPGTLFVGARSAQGEIEAVTMFLFCGSHADSFLNAATIEGRRHSRGLYWLGVMRLREIGVQMVNLGGGIVPGDGLSEFKIRLGATRSPTVAIKQIFDRVRYGSACNSVGVSADAEGYFPAWRGPAAQESQASRNWENRSGSIR